jgi:hypothetical protein
VVLEKNGEDLMDRPCGESIKITWSQGKGNMAHGINETGNVIPRFALVLQWKGNEYYIL